MGKSASIFFKQKARLKQIGFSFALLVLVSCSKQDVQTEKSITITDFHLSKSNIVLLEGNAFNTAVTFNWQGGDAAGKIEAVYTIEAAEHNSSFADPLVISSGTSNAMYFSVSDFNALMRKLVYANANAIVDFRVKADIPGSNNKSVYSPEIALNVTTYLPTIEYNEKDILRLPGNYEGWNLVTAPRIVSKENAGEYEGYINFSDPYPQLLLVKGAVWDPNITFTYVGGEKFGFGGSMLSIFGGAGVYLFKASTNTNKWSYTKINTWNLVGSSARNVSASMTADDSGLAWTITANLVQGDFRINANNSSAISFGYKPGDNTGVPSYDGENIVIKKDGNYTIKLELQQAGNYNYSIHRNN